MFYLTFIGGSFTRSLVLTLANVNWVGFKCGGIEICCLFNFGYVSPSDTILLQTLVFSFNVIICKESLYLAGSLLGSRSLKWTSVVCLCIKLLQSIKSTYKRICRALKYHQYVKKTKYKYQIKRVRSSKYSV